MKPSAASAGSVERFGGVWGTLESTMRDLLLDSYSELVPNPELAQDAFDLGGLESH